MNTMIVYFLMLKPALLAGVLLIGIPFAIGLWALPRLRDRMRKEATSVGRLDRGAVAQKVRMGP